MMDNTRSQQMECVRVSQASRSDAHRDPSNGIRFETYTDEYNHWVTVAQSIDAELAGYSKAYFTGEQARIRRENAHNSEKSLRLWLARRQELDTKRRKLIERKVAAVAELGRLKSLKIMENQRINDGPDVTPGERKQRLLDLGGLMQEMVDELRAIRNLLASK